MSSYTQNLRLIMNSRIRKMLILLFVKSHRCSCPAHLILVDRGSHGFRGDCFCLLIMNHHFYGVTSLSMWLETLSVSVLGCVLNHPVTGSGGQRCSRLPLCLLCMVSSRHPSGFTKQVSSVGKEEERDSRKSLLSMRSVRGLGDNKDR